MLIPILSAIGLVALALCGIAAGAELFVRWIEKKGHDGL